MEDKVIEPKQIDKILQALTESSVEELVIEDSRGSIHIVRDMYAKHLSKKSETSPNAANSIDNEKTLEKENDVKEEMTDYKDILSPEVGTFLRSAKDESQILIKLRDEVKEGQTLAYIQSTGIMYEVKSEYDGKITEILVEDGQAVEFAQPLFRLK